ncbi:alpha/beta hydrolase [Pseudoalteromonas sp. T1lg65]|uniref:alpha/beta hydrolase n=1 Tax=Pseudoalteromonas sp. T1lg65 TaxID=2077101 RepID=UPI003F7AFE00
MQYQKLLGVFCTLTMLPILTACLSDNGTHNPDIETPSSESALTKKALDNRVYYLATPDQQISKDKAYKLLLAFHGSGGSAEEMAFMSNLHNLNDDFLVVYPKSKNEEWNEGCDCNKAHRLGINDLGFVDKIVDQVKQDYRILEGEIYATGFSQGGLFVQNLLCNRSEVFKGISTVAAPMSMQLSHSCNFSQPTHFRLLHGKKDSVLPFNGSNHSNFGLISSPQAIKVIAGLNYQEATQATTTLTEGVTLTHYPDQAVKTELLAIEQAGHSWQLPPLDTSKAVLQFFNSASQYELPEHSDLIDIKGHYYHVRQLSVQPEKPTVVLISGLTKHYHADTGWFSLLQPYLSEDFNVISIDRLGRGLSGEAEMPSMTQFAEHLPAIFSSLELENVHLVSFASGNSVPVIAFKQSPDFKDKIASMLWLDPDTLLPFSISHYQGFPVTIYRKHGQVLFDHIAAGGWHEAMEGKLVEEREHVEQLLENSEFKAYMDWDYFNLLLEKRRTLQAQVQRAKDVYSYHDDLNYAAGWKPDASIPITVIDSAFEKLDIAQAQDEESKQHLTQWEQESRHWSMEIAESSGGQYIPLDSTEHIIPLSHPDVIKQALIELTRP